MDQPWLPIFYESTTPDAFFGLTTADWVAVVSGLVGALLGAVVGGIISARIQRQASVEAGRLAEAERQAVAKGQALRTMIRASIILNDVQSTVAAIHNQLERANAHKMSDQPLWARVAGIVGSRSAQPLEISDLLPFIDGRKYELVGKYIEMTMQHDILNDSINLYNERRAVLKDLLSATESNGSLMFTPMNAELEAKLRPHSIEMESLIQAIKPRAEALLKSAKDLNSQIGPAGRELFGPSFPGIDVTDTPA